MAQKIEIEREFLARRLREERDYLGLSQEYVSQQTDIPRPAISEIEAGRRRVESLELRRLARLYGRPIEYFLPENEKSKHSGGSTHKEDAVELKLRNMTKNLTAGDREEILRFAEYLRHKKVVTKADSNSSNEG